MLHQYRNRRKNTTSDRDPRMPNNRPLWSLSTKAACLLVLVTLAACRKQAPKKAPRRPGDLRLVHPMARNVDSRTLQGKRIMEMDVPVPVRRALAYYEHGLAKSWHILTRESNSQGTHIRVRRGLQLLDIYASANRTGTHLRLVEQVENATPPPTDSISPGRHPPEQSADGRQNAASHESAPGPRATATSPSLDRPQTKEPTLPRDIRLPRGWKPASKSTFIHKSQKLSSLARQIRRTLTSQGWTVMPSPDQQTADRPNVLDQILSKGRRVLYLHMKSTADGTLLTWMIASL